MCNLPRRNIQLYQEGTAVDIPGGDYDAVFSNGVLHWCEDKGTIFKTVLKSLKEMGKFGFVIPNNFDIIEQFCTPADMFSDEYRQYFMSKYHIPSTKELCNIIDVSGFQKTHMCEHIREFKFESVAKLIEFFRTTFSKFDGHHYNVEAMKRRYGDGEIVFKVPCTTVILVK